MTPEMWQRLKPLYHAALEMPVEARSNFVISCTDDEELRKELRSLLKASDEETVSHATPFIDFRNLFPTKPRCFSAGEIIMSRFRILRYLGGGGMGEVYEALDLELGRVALKTIRPEIADDPDTLSRFKREVQLALRITGPHVCRIHAFYVLPNCTGKSTRAFLTMEFLDGITLADKLRSSGPVPWQEAKLIALDICRGLQTIHEAGIIHRDLKSSNIMITLRGGCACAVLMDFGLAQEARSSVAEEDSRPALTSRGAVVGTPEYMAPEQFACDHVTPATDIFALGVVLYELVTGNQPFPSGTILHAAVQRGRRPAAPSTVRKGLPHRWDGILYRCLEFDPARRYQTAAAVAADIRNPLFSKTALRRTWLRMAAGLVSLIVLLLGLLLVPAVRERAQGILLASREKRIAILPFEVAAGDPQTQALGDGLTNSLAGALSNLDASNSHLWVTPPAELRARNVKDAEGALREFGATIVVMGRFERNDQGANLALTLVDTRKMKEIGYAEITSQAGDLVTLEKEAMTRLGRLLNLSNAENALNGETASVGSAYKDYLTGLGYIQRYDIPGSLDAAILSLRRAVTADPQFALGFAELGEAYRLKYQLDQNQQWLAEAQSYSDTALNLDRGIALPYVTLAHIHELSGQRDLALDEVQRALRIDPANANTLDSLAYIYEHLGNAALAEATFEKVVALRPDDWNSYEELGNFYERQHELSLALAQYQDALELSPDSAQVYSNIGQAYLDSGDPRLLPAAMTALQKSIALAPTYYALANLGVLYGNERRYSDYAAFTERALQLNGLDWRVWDNLVLAYEWMRDEKKADMALHEMGQRLEVDVKLKPRDADAQSTLAIVYAHDGLRDKAVRHVQTALALAPTDPAVLSNIADAYESLGQRREALAYLNQAFRKGLTREDAEGDPWLQAVVKEPDHRLPPK